MLFVNGYQIIFTINIQYGKLVLKSELGMRLGDFVIFVVEP